MKYPYRLTIAALVALSLLGCPKVEQTSKAPEKPPEITWDNGKIFPSYTSVKGTIKFYVYNSAKDYTTCTTRFKYYSDEVEYPVVVSMGGIVGSLDPAIISLDANLKLAPKIDSKCEGHVYVHATNKDRTLVADLHAVGNGSISDYQIDINP